MMDSDSNDLLSGKLAPTCTTQTVAIDDVRPS